MNEKGYLYVETLILITITGILFVSGATVGRKFLLNTLAEYEAIKLITNLRYVQEQNRNSYIVRANEFPAIEPQKSTQFVVNVYDNFYQIKSRQNKFSPQRYNAIKNVTFGKTSSFSNGIIFRTDGDPKNFGSITVKAKFGKNAAYRYVIIDKAGRIRLDRKSP